MKKLQITLLLICVLSTSGCAAKIKYGFDKSLHKREEPHPMTALVDAFQDLRTQDEHDGTFSVTKGYTYTRDKNFKKDIDAQVTKALTKHIEKAKLFESVEQRDIDNGIVEDQEAMGSLAAEGFDIVIMGDLYHFYGYQSGATSAAVSGALFGVVGVMTEAMVNRKVVGGRAAIGDIKIVDLKQGAMLWEGDIDHQYEHKETFYDGPPAYAIRALKGANDKLIQQIDDVISNKDEEIESASAHR